MSAFRALSAVFIFGWLHPAHADDANPIGYASVAETLAALRADPAARISTQQGWTVIWKRKDRQQVMWTFTPPGHPAHPAVVRRTMFEKDGAWYQKMTALCQSDKSSCDKLMEEFRKLNDQMKEYIQKRQQSGSAR